MRAEKASVDGALQDEIKTSIFLINKEFVVLFAPWTSRVRNDEDADTFVVVCSVDLHRVHRHELVGVVVLSLLGCCGLFVTIRNSHTFLGRHRSFFDSFFGRGSFVVFVEIVFLLR